MVKESSFQKFVINNYIKFMGQNFGSRAGEFLCENSPGAALTSRVHSNWFQNGFTAGQSWGNQQSWWNLYDKMFRKVYKVLCSSCERKD